MLVTAGCGHIGRSLLAAVWSQLSAAGATLPPPGLRSGGWSVGEAGRASFLIRQRRTVTVIASDSRSSLAGSEGSLSSPLAGSQLAPRPKDNSQHSLRPVYVPGAVSVFIAWSITPGLFTTMLGGLCCYHPHFREETQAERSGNLLQDTQLAGSEWMTPGCQTPASLTHAPSTLLSPSESPPTPCLQVQAQLLKGTLWGKEVPL